MEKKEAKKVTAAKPVKEKKEIPDKDLNNANGGTQCARDGVRGAHYTPKPEGHWWTAGSDD